ncbi:hypothetical protein BFJ63_vAg16737 [Fusarium oxysporum f. sp. narcissi]|uniref:Amidohydrolase 3 domain-containing protein n=1 Tax=Fusarium oxysporum f. sp. narcissi TaxID=451672 RepID=A0A4Q2V1E4_FUSOX|nr:hypothetical protein BFJ63_vAg16737 [Fusarium oxysporum f. sp. narcissi]
MSSPTISTQNVAYINGEVIRSARAPVAQAILILDSKVAAIGTNEEVKAAVPDGVEVRNLDGAAVVPGLIDNHPHLLHFAAFKAPLVDIQNVKNHAEIIALIRERAASTPKDEWIICSPIGEQHFFQRRSYKTLEEGTFPTREVLDQATNDHPVAIQAWAPVIPNIAGFNSKALEKLGLDSKTPNKVSNVYFDKDDNGELTGVARGHVNAYYNLDKFWLSLATQMPPVVNPNLVYGSTVQAMAEYNAMGITAIHEAHAMEEAHIGVYKHLRANQDLTLRVQCSHELEPNALIGNEPRNMAEINRILQVALDDVDTDDDWLRISGITTCAFGPAYCGVMLWTKGYSDAYGNRTGGIRRTDMNKIEAAFDFCVRTGLKLNICSCSPEEHDQYIDLTKKVKDKYNMGNPEWLIEHGYLMRPDQPKKLRDLGYDITVSGAFTYGKGDMFVERFGEEILASLNIYRTMIDGGLKPAGSMDWGPINPWEQMALAVTHLMASGKNNAKPNQVVTRQEAFEMWTTNGAHVLRWKGIGDLEVGSHADIAIIDRNSITCHIDDLPNTKVHRTILGGKVVYDDGTIG